MNSLQKAIQNSLQKDPQAGKFTKMEILQSMEPQYSKYNVRTDEIGRKSRTVDNIEFDSQAEANYYLKHLRMLVKAREIFDLEFQVIFVLLDKFTDWSGKIHQPITYIADFVYRDKLKKKWVIDRKGEKTEVYRLKKKMFLFKYPGYCFLEVISE